MHTVADLQLISAESDAVRGVCALESSSFVDITFPYADIPYFRSEIDVATF